jgi:hypothetical protein
MSPEASSCSIPFFDLNRLMSVTLADAYSDNTTHPLHAPNFFNEGTALASKY